MCLLSFPLFGLQLGWSQESPPSLKFDHARRRAGEAPTPKSVVSIDGKGVLKVQSKRTVQLCEGNSGKALGPEIALGDKRLSFVITALAIAPDGKTIATGIGNHDNDSGKVDVWDGTTGKRIARYEGPPYLGTVFTLSFSEDGKTLSITSGPPGGK